MKYPSWLLPEKTWRGVSNKQLEPGAFQSVNSLGELLLLKYRLPVAAVKYSGMCCARACTANLYAELLIGTGCNLESG